jgi:hypothetical protein
MAEIFIRIGLTMFVVGALIAAIAIMSRFILDIWR